MPFSGDGADEAGLPLGDISQDEERGPDTVRPQERQAGDRCSGRHGSRKAPHCRGPSTDFTPHTWYQSSRSTVRAFRSRALATGTGGPATHRAEPRAPVRRIGGPDLACRRVHHFPGARLEPALGHAAVPAGGIGRRRALPVFPSGLRLALQVPPRSRRAYRAPPRGGVRAGPAWPAPCRFPSEARSPPTAVWPPAPGTAGGLMSASSPRCRTPGRPVATALPDNSPQAEGVPRGPTRPGRAGRSTRRPWPSRNSTPRWSPVSAERLQGSHRRS